MQWQSISTFVDKRHLHLLKQSPRKAHSGFCWHFKKLLLLIGFFKVTFQSKGRHVQAREQHARRLADWHSESEGLQSWQWALCSMLREAPSGGFGNIRVFILRVCGSQIALSWSWSNSFSSLLLFEGATVFFDFLSYSFCEKLDMFTKCLIFKPWSLLMHIGKVIRHFHLNSFWGGSYRHWEHVLILSNMT